MLSQAQLEAYFIKIGLSHLSSQTEKPSFSLLREVLFHHVLTFPFENIDMHNVLNQPTKKPIDISIDAILEKFLCQNRGGYCFETNELLRQVLLSLHFDVKTYLAGVLWLKEKKTPPFHQVLIIKIDEDQYLVEPGFGTPSPIEPLKLCAKEAPFLENQLFPQHDIKAFRFVIDKEGDFQLQGLVKVDWYSQSDWKPLYSFNTKSPATQVQLSESNWRVSVSEESPFLGRLFVTQPFLLGNGLSGRRTLTDKFYKVLTHEGVVQTPVASQAHFLQLLASEFKIKLQDGSNLEARQVRFEQPPIEKLAALLSASEAQPLMQESDKSAPPLPLLVERAACAAASALDQPQGLKQVLPLKRRSG